MVYFGVSIEHYTKMNCNYIFLSKNLKLYGSCYYHQDFYFIVNQSQNTSVAMRIFFFSYCKIPMHTIHLIVALMAIKSIIKSLFASCTLNIPLLFCLTILWAVTIDGWNKSFVLLLNVIETWIVVKNHWHSKAVSRLILSSYGFLYRSGICWNVS